MWLELTLGAVSLMIGGYAFRRTSLCIAAAGLWLLFSVYAYTQSSGTFTNMDVEYGAFLIGFGMMAMCASEVMFMRDPVQEEELEQDLLDPLPSDVEENLRNMKALRERMAEYKGSTPSRRNRARYKRRIKKESKRYSGE